MNTHVFWNRQNPACRQSSLYRQGLVNRHNPTATGFLVALLLLAAAACSPPEIMLLETGTFEPSDIDKHDFYEQYVAGNRSLISLSGRANVQVSEPGNTKRLTVSFQSDRRESLMTLRNNLGIEGGRIYSNPDSVIIYNRLEDIAHKMSHEDATWFYLNGVAAMNLLQLLDPISEPEHIHRIFENDTFYLVETDQGDRHYFEKDQLVLRRTDRKVYQPEAYSTFQFDNFVDIEGFRLPRRLQILSYDEKSNIFLVIRALDINPANLEFDPNIPGDIEIDRI